MKPLILSADQVRISCQAEAFLTHMVNERFEDIAADSQWHVGLHPLADGVRMNVGVHVKGTVNDESFMVRRPFGSHDGTSQIFWGCEEMIDDLRKSVDSIFPPEVECTQHKHYDEDCPQCNAQAAREAKEYLARVDEFDAIHGADEVDRMWNEIPIDDDKIEDDIEEEGYLDDPLDNCDF